MIFMNPELVNYIDTYNYFLIFFFFLDIYLKKKKIDFIVQQNNWGRFIFVVYLQG